MKLLLLHNQGAGPESVPGEDLRRTFGDAGFQVTYRSKQDDAVTDEDLRTADVLVVAGGDGTVGSAMRRFRHRIDLFSILPLGTANNIATALGITGDVDVFARGLHGAAEQGLDVGLAAWPGGQQDFLEGIGAGPIAEAMAAVEGKDLDSQAAGQLSRDLLPDFFARARPKGWRVRVDGEPLPDDLLMVEVLNGPLIGPGLLPAPGGKLGDRIFDVAFLRPQRQAACVAALRQDPVPQPLPLEVVRGREVTMELSDTVLRIDDCFVDRADLPRDLRLSFAPDQVRVLIPGGA
ncbi:diacylglycerol/lipid kinase family protein [Falsiroseomonas sp. HC035]|uniref:diacylglycerol/lipid kinase family protein n=1 Tax=Falsiroseomonas sp. HC035 TaxID=3390999 RepID=UPI003D31BC75